MALSPLADLPQDARVRVLDFLGLWTCLTYCQVSKRSLLDTLPALKHRRNRQFCERFVYRLIPDNNNGEDESSPDKWSAEFCLRSARDISDYYREDAAPLLIQCNQLDYWKWYLLPSVTERIEHLYKYLPSSHPSKEMLGELLQDITRQQEVEDDFDDFDQLLSFEKALSSLRAIMKAHRLHETILSKSSIQFETAPAGVYNETSLKLPLEHYIGDVQIVSHLLGHSVAGMVEGRTTHAKWTTFLISCIRSYRSNGDHGWDPILVYQVWVYLHSTVVQTLPMTLEQIRQFRLFPDCGVQCPITFSSTPTTTSVDGATQSILCVQPHVPYANVSSNLETIRHILTIGVPVLPDNEPRPVSTLLPPFEHRTILNQFGPLGPAFRGRDRIETAEMSFDTFTRFCYSVLCDLTPLRWSVAHCNDGIMDSPIISPIRYWLRALDNDNFVLDRDADNILWDRLDILSGSSASWMLKLTRECYRNRPMTVEPPLVSLELLH